MLRPVFLAALCAAFEMGCAGASGANRGERVLQPPAARSLPEPDPSLRLTVRESLAAHRLERVVVKVAVDRTGKPTLIDFLTPDLTPAVALELRKAFEKCIWKPRLGPNGEPEEGEITLLFHTEK